jgi:catechol 2,3-dioxygenase-like lactoylglutathione lyase family enzyme
MLNYRHTGIIVRNINKSYIFYNKLLKLKKVSRIIESGEYFNSLTNTKNLKADVLKLRTSENIIIEIIQYINFRKKKNKPKNMLDTGTMHMCFTVKNIFKIYDKLKKNKIKFFSKPLISPYDPVITCFCYDPDYNLVQFVEGPQVKKKI